MGLFLRSFVSTNIPSLKKKKKKKKCVKRSTSSIPEASPLYEGIKMAGRFHIDGLNYKARGSGGWQ